MTFVVLLCEVQPDTEGLTCCLEPGEVYISEQDVDNGDAVSGPQGRQPLQPKAFRLLETPILHSFRYDQA